MPKLLGVATKPRPKWCCQIRLTITRAVSGLSALAIALGQLEPAAAVLERCSDRRPAPSGTAAATLAPGVSGLPRIKTGMSVGRDASPSVWITGYLGRSLFLQAGRARPAAPATFVLASSVSMRFDLLELVAGHLLFQARGFRLEERA